MFFTFLGTCQSTLNRTGHNDVRHFLFGLSDENTFYSGRRVVMTQK